MVPLSREGMSNVISHSLPKAQLLSALGSHRPARYASAWRRSLFPPHQKNSDKRTIENAKNPAQPTLCSSHRRDQGAAHPWRPRIFQNFDEQSVANGRNPRNQPFADTPPASPPSNRKKSQNRATKVMQTLKITSRQWLARGPVPPPRRSARP